MARLGRIDIHKSDVNPGDDESDVGIASLIDWKVHTGNLSVDARRERHQILQLTCRKSL